MTFIDLRPQTVATDGEGRTVIFEDGEENVPVTDASLTSDPQTLTVRLYGEEYTLRLEEVAR